MSAALKAYPVLGRALIDAMAESIAPGMSDEPKTEMARQIARGFSEAIGGDAYIIGKEYPVKVTIHGTTRLFAVRRDSSGGPHKMRTLFEGGTNGPVFVTYRFDKNGELIEVGRRYLACFADGVEAKVAEFKEMFGMASLLSGPSECPKLHARYTRRKPQ